ncbi:MAG: UDP-glucose/GDP-mannose dehydrogenase family protein [Bauldia sp.]
MRIQIIGTGYVGLVSGTCFADIGHDVVCADIDKAKIAGLKKGILPIHEPGLAELVETNVANGRLCFTDDLADRLSDARLVFLAVGTPSRGEDGEADLRHIFAAVDAIAPHLAGDAIVVSKSTVPVGTGDRIQKRLAALRPDVEVVSCPEFLKEGDAIRDFMQPSRVVVGTDSKVAADALREAYAPIIDAGSPYVVMARRSAELTKYAANAFLAMKVAFINEIADFCEKTGAAVDDVAAAIGLDPRIGPAFLKAGPGYGGSCFPKDTLALVRNGEAINSSLSIVDTVVAVNDRRKRLMANRVVDACGGSIAGKRVAMLGVTFKPNTDDMRDSPSIPIARRLLDFGAEIVAFDPKGEEQARQIPTFDEVSWAASAQQALHDADVAVIVTDWDEFRTLAPETFVTEMAEPIVVDLRNLYRPDHMAEAGVTYVSIGRAPRSPERPRARKPSRRLRPAATAAARAMAE